MEQLALGVLERHIPIELPPLRGATVEHIVERVRGDIMSRRIEAGAHLVENDLTARFAVSRGPVREALRRLAAEGLIDHFPHRGAWVRRLGVAEVRELFQVRIELEALAARLAAEVGDPRARAEFEVSTRPLFRDDPRREVDYLAQDTAFHEAVFTLAGNGQLQDFSRRLQVPLLTAQIADALTDDALAASAREHRAIAAAILAGDAAGASATMRAHLARAAEIAAAAGQGSASGAPS